MCSNVKLSASQLQHYGSFAPGLVPLSPRPRFWKFPVPYRMFPTGSCLMLICGADDAGFPVYDLYLRSLRS